MAAPSIKAGSHCRFFCVISRVAYFIVNLLCALRFSSALGRRYNKETKTLDALVLIVKRLVIDSAAMNRCREPHSRSSRRCDWRKDHGLDASATDNRVSSGSDCLAAKACAPSLPAYQSMVWLWLPTSSALTFDLTRRPLIVWWWLTRVSPALTLLFTRSPLTAWLWLSRVSSALPFVLRSCQLGQAHSSLRLCFRYS